MKAKQKKPNRPKAINPKGFKDYSEREVNERTEMLRKIAEIYFAYGFEALETPAVETVEALGSFLPDVDRPNAGVFSWLDEGEKWLALRYDLTAPLARFYAQNRHRLANPYRRFAMGPVWRNEKPGPGRFREFLQFDADFVGTKNLQADAELCILISEILEECGLTKKDYLVKISSRKITEKLFKNININDGEQKLITLRALDKIDRLGWDEVEKLLGKGRKDKSGDFTQGANLNKSSIEIIKKELNKDTPDTEDLMEIIDLFKKYGFSNYKFDPSIVRGLEYYTGPIFEVDLNFDVKNNKGQIIQFGSIGGGGRYDNLVSNFGNYDAPATGISIGLDRLVYALMQRKEFNINQSRPIIICVFDKNLMKYYIDLQKILRGANIGTEIYPGENKLKKQMEYANKIKSPAVILYGENEIKIGKPTIRELSSGEEKSIKIEDLVNEIQKII